MAKKDALAWVEEFLWRGRSSGSGLEPTWHVMLGAIVDDGHGGKTAVVKGPLSPEEAEKLGWPLSRIETAINADALAEAGRLQGDLEELARRHHELSAAHEHLRAAVHATNESAAPPPRPGPEALMQLRAESESVAATEAAAP